MFNPRCTCRCRTITAICMSARCSASTLPQLHCSCIAKQPNDKTRNTVFPRSNAHFLVDQMHIFWVGSDQRQEQIAGHEAALRSMLGDTPTSTLHCQQCHVMNEQQLARTRAAG
jgi:hypothetical protein